MWQGYILGMALVSIRRADVRHSCLDTPNYVRHSAERDSKSSIHAHRRQSPSAISFRDALNRRGAGVVRRGQLLAQLPQAAVADRLTVRLIPQEYRRFLELGDTRERLDALAQGARTRGFVQCVVRVE